MKEISTIADRAIAEKTLKQQLIEARAGKDVRDVLAEAYQASDTLQGATAWIEFTYGVHVSVGVMWNWVQDFRGVVRRTLEFPAEEMAEEVAA